jgi:hypothetical protein
MLPGKYGNYHTAIWRHFYQGRSRLSDCPCFAATTMHFTRFLIRVLAISALSFAAFGIAIAAAPAQTVDYQPLRQALTARDWLRSDRETRLLISQLIAADPYYYDNNELDRLSCVDLNRIDRLWQKASQNRFGWRSQLQIWKQVQTADSRNTVTAFRDRVGWQRSEPLTEEQASSFRFDHEWRSELDLNDTLDAPIGHLPWGGVSQSTIDDLLSQDGPSCGSCAIDAYHLQSERFYRYLPQLFARIEKCLFPRV